MLTAYRLGWILQEESQPGQNLDVQSLVRLSYADRNEFAKGFLDSKGLPQIAFPMMTLQRFYT